MAVSRLFGLAQVCVLAVVPAVNADTTWINPRGGDWGTAANWSAGVPDADDDVVFPSLNGGQPYVIELSDQRAVRTLDIAGSVVLTGGGSVHATSSVTIGDASGASLALEGTHLGAGDTITIGAIGGVGSLGLTGAASSASAVWIFCGQLGSATLSLSSGSHIDCDGLILGDGASTELLLTAQGAPLIEAGIVVPNGALTISTGAPLVPPMLVAIPLATFAVSTGVFDSIVTDELFGQFPQVSVEWNAWTLEPFDPVVDLSIAPDSAGYVGYDVPLSAAAKRLSGATFPVPPSVPEAPATWSTGDALMGVVNDDEDDPTFRGLQPGYALVSLSLDVYGAAVATSSSVPILVPSLPQPEAIDVGADGAQPDALLYASLNANASLPAARISGNGRYVVFRHMASNLGESDPSPDNPDLFLKDRVTGAVEVLSGPAQLPGGMTVARSPDISDDGRFVVFDVTNYHGEVAVWLVDRELGTWTEVSAGTSHTPANGPSCCPRISGDGSTMVFLTQSTNLVSNDVNGKMDVVAYGVLRGGYDLVSATADGMQGEIDIDDLAISDDGYVVAFTTRSTFGMDLTTARHVFAKSRVTGELQLVSVGADGQPAALNARWPKVDATGRRIVFQSEEALVPGAFGTQLYMRDLIEQSTTGVSIGASTMFVPCGVPILPSISGDGSTVAFSVMTPNHHGGIEGFCRVVRVRPESGIVQAVDETPWGDAVGAASTDVDLSSDGSIVLFTGAPQGLAPFAETISSRVWVREFAQSASGDLTGDGQVTSADLAALLGAWATSGPGDLNGDGIVNAADLTLLLGAWTG